MALVANILYVDTSSVIRIALGDHDGPELEKVMKRYTDLGVKLASSKLLELECRRATIRLKSEGMPYQEIERLASNVELLPITDEIWELAKGIGAPVKSLDAIHLATASIVPNCQLLTSDKNMQVVAPTLGITLAKQPVMRLELCDGGVGVLGGYGDD